MTTGAGNAPPDGEAGNKRLDWKKVKTLLICLLLIVNAALGGILLLRGTAESARERSADEYLRKLLGERGVDTGQTEIPGGTALRYDITRDASAELAMAEALLGKLERVDGSYSYYEGAGGRADFRSAGRFEILPVSPVVIDGGIGSVAAAMGMAPTDRALENDTLTMYVEGLPVWNMTASFSVREGRLASVSGTWLTGRPLPVSDEKCYSAGYCLLSLADSLSDSDERRRLLSCRLGFMSERVSPDTERLVPHWLFELSDGLYYVNAFTAKAA